MKPTLLLQHINLGIFLVAVLLIPVFFLPITSEFYEFNKQALLILAAASSLVVWTTSFALEKQVRITRSPAGLPMLALIAAWTASALLSSPNRFDAFLEPGQAGTIIALGILFFTGINSIHSKRQLDLLTGTFTASLALLSGFVILWSSGLMEQIIPFSFMKSSIWTPLGNPFSAIAVLATSVPFTAIILIKGRFEPQSSRAILLIATLVLSLASTSLLTYRLFFQPSSPNRPVFLPQTVSWAIAMETLKVSPLLGTGPSTYLANFTRYRPVSYNNSDIWAVRFTSSSNYYLQLLSTVGFLGLSAYLFLAMRTFRLFTRSWKTAPESSLHPITIAASATALIAMASQVFIPPSVVFLFVIFVLLVIATAAFKLLGSSLVHEANIDIVAATDTGSRSPILPRVCLLASVILALPSLYYFSKAYIAEVYYQSALTAAAAKDGKKTYEALTKAIRFFPYKDTYSNVLAQTSLLLANSLASGKTELNPDERKLITQLIQQSIFEAKRAVSLNPAKVTNVEVLAGVYRNLIPFAKDADAWTVASYRQAIQLDPTNPNIRIALGGVLYGAKNYDDAIRLFQSAVDLKPDHANAHYNLAAAYREKGDLQKAVASLSTVVNLVSKDSADYTKALAELEDLKKKAGEKVSLPPIPAEPAKTNLEAPKPLPSPQLDPPIELPSNLGPETVNSPTPTGSP